VDVVHTQLPFIYPTYAAAKAAIHSQKPLYYQQRGVFDPERLKFRALKKKIYISIIERPIMREATTLIALTQTEVQTYRALGVWTPCRIVPNGVDIIEDTCGLEHLAATFTFSLDDIVILFMARLHPIKGADRLIRAFLSINREFPRAKLILAGPDEWGIASQFRQEIAEAGALDKVIFAGMADGQIKQGILERADLFCLPSDAEGFSMGVLEALASSTAVLISPGCHFPEVEAFGAGRIVRPEPDLLASAIAELIGNREQLREMGRKGRILVEQRYSWDGITDLLEEVYFEGIDRHQSITAQQPTRRRVIKHLP